MTAAGRQRTLAAARADIAAGVWLKTRDLARLGGRRWLGPAAAACYLLVWAALLTGALWVHSTGVRLPLTSLLTPLWLLWAVLPAVGGGGGDVDSAAALAPYPVSGLTQLTATWTSGVLDVQYLLPVPAVTAAIAASYGPVALLPAGCFILGASALGQLTGWAAAGGVTGGRGTTLTVTGALVAGLAAGRVAGVNVAHALTAGPVLLVTAAAHAAAAGRWPLLAGCSAVLLSPALVHATVGPRLVARCQLARLTATSTRKLTANTRSLPRPAAAALFTATLRSVTRSLAFKAVLLAAGAVPFVASMLSHHVTGQAIAALTLVAGGSSVAANCFAYDAGGSVLLLSAPLRRSSMVLLRVAVLLTALSIIGGGVEILAVLTGVIPPRLSDLGFELCLLVVVAGAGIRTASASPSAADLDTLRGRPAAFGAALAYTVRAGAVTAILTGLWGIAGGPLIAAAVSVGYLAMTTAGAVRRLRDGAALLAAFATTR